AMIEDVDAVAAEHAEEAAARAAAERIEIAPDEVRLDRCDRERDHRDGAAEPGTAERILAPPAPRRDRERRELDERIRRQDRHDADRDDAELLAEAAAALRDDVLELDVIEP